MNPLTVKELILVLEKLPPNLLVFANDECWYCNVYGAKEVPARVDECRLPIGSTIVLLDN